MRAACFALENGKFDFSDVGSVDVFCVPDSFLGYDAPLLYLWWILGVAKSVTPIGESGCILFRVKRYI